MASVYKVVAAACVVIVVVLLVLRLFAPKITRSVLFPGSLPWFRDMRARIPVPASGPTQYEFPVTVRDNDDGTTFVLRNLIIPPTSGSAKAAPLIVHCHGNTESAMTAAMSQHIAARFPTCTVLAVEYRGYGTSSAGRSKAAALEGVDVEPCASKLGSDAFAVVQSAIAKLAPSTVVLWGYSIGGAAALQLLKVWAEQPGKTPPFPLAAVVIDSSFKRTWDCLPAPARFVAKVLAGTIANIDHSALESCSRLSDVPVMVTHSIQDTVVPYTSSLELTRTLKKAGANVRHQTHGGAHGSGVWQCPSGALSLVAWLRALLPLA